jgi:YjbE family integral membrane protein
VEFFSSFIRIVIIDLVLSGDNAVVIGMAAHRLEPRQRKVAILVGGGAAIALRIGLTVIASFLLTITGLQLIGGVLLIWIGFKLLRQEEADTQASKSRLHEGRYFHHSLADVIMVSITFSAWRAPAAAI